MNNKNSITGIFSSRLKLVRNLKNLTQQELGKKIGKNGSAIGLYEQGRRVPDINTLRKMTEVLDVSADFLLGITSKNNYEIIQPDSDDPKIIDYLVVGKELKDIGLSAKLLKNIVDLIKNSK